MEGSREDVETSPSPFSSAVSPPREVDGVSQIWSLPGTYILGCQSERSADICSRVFMSIWPFFI